MSTLRLGQHNPLVYKRTFPDPGVLDDLDYAGLVAAAGRLGIDTEYPVRSGEDLDVTSESYSEGSLRDILANHQSSSPSRTVAAAVTTISTSPDSTLAQTIDELTRVVERHGDPPEWVDGDDELLVQIVARMYDATIGEPADVEVRFYTEHGPAGVGPDGPLKPPRKPDGGSLLGFMLAMPLLALRLGLHLRTDAGRDHQIRVSFDTASTGTGSYAAANYIGLTEDATAPNASDTTLTSELTGEGLARAQAMYAHTNGTATATLTKTFTMSSGTSRTIRHAGDFNASSSGTMAYKTAVPSPPTLVPGDSVAITWTYTA